MVSYDYKSVLLETIKSKSGMDITWADINVSAPISTSGATATVTLSPTETAAFKGKVNVQIKRMVVDNQDLVFTKYYSNNITPDSDVFIIKSVPKTAAEFLALLSERMGFEITSEDFNPPTLPTTVEQEVLVTLTAKPTSRYFYGTLRVRFLPELINLIRFECNLPADLLVYKNWLYATTYIVDGVVQDMSAATWNLPAGKHTIEIRGLTSTPYRLYNFNPTKLLSFRYFDTNAQFTSAMAACTNLTEIAEEAFYVLGGVFTAFFQKCSGLKTLPKRLFAAGSIADGIDWLFVETGITGVPATLFNDLQVRGTTIDMVFGSCSALSDVPVGLFTNFTNVKTFSRMFMQSGIVTAKRNVFSGLTSVTSFSDAYNGCRQLKTVEAGALSGMPSLTTEQRTFQGCTQLNTVNAPLFNDDGGPTTLISMTSTFATTVALKQIPENLFEGCNSVTILSAILKGGGITTIPEKLLTYTPGLVQLLNVFSGCVSLTAIPTNLMTPVPKLVYMTGAFSACTGIKTIPTTLLSSLPSLAVIESLFDGCTGLTAIPGDLFANNLKLLNVNNLFRNVPAEFTLTSSFFPGTAITQASGAFLNSGLKAIAGGLFANHNKLSVAAATFSKTLLTKVPAGTINITAATFANLTSLFEGCTLLTEVESGAVVVSLPASTNSTSLGTKMFSGCVALASLGKGAVSLSGSISNLDYAFSGCSALYITTSGLCDAFVVNLNLDASITFSAISFCDGVIWLKGSCMGLWNTLTNNAVPGVKRIRNNVVENCFLLDDYEAVGKPWWTTPISVTRVSGLPLSVFAVDDIYKASGDLWVPYFATINADLPPDLLRNTPAITNSAPNADMQLWLKKVIAQLGLSGDITVTTITTDNTVRGNGDFPATAVRSEVQRVVRAVINRPVVGQDWSGYDVYWLCSLSK